MGGKLFKTFEHGRLPNTYDALKLLALAAMIIDHVGFYLFPTELWLRVLGRLAFPIFLFLVGYSRSTRFDQWLLIGGIAVWINTMLIGYHVLPLNILFSILVWRVVLHIMRRHPALFSDLGILWVALLFLHIPVSFVLEYGALGLMYALLGHFTREERNEERGIRFFWLATIVVTVAQQSASFEFDAWQVWAYICLSVLMAIGLMQFKLEPLWVALREDEKSTEPQPEDAPLEAPAPTLKDTLMVLLARNTLLIYVLHIIALQWWAVQRFPTRFAEGFPPLF